MLTLIEKFTRKKFINPNQFHCRNWSRTDLWTLLLKIIKKKNCQIILSLLMPFPLNNTSILRSTLNRIPKINFIAIPTTKEKINDHYRLVVEEYVIETFKPQAFYNLPPLIIAFKVNYFSEDCHNLISMLSSHYNEKFLQVWYWD